MNAASRAARDSSYIESFSCASRLDAALLG
jgi:hypothetical protein